MRSTSTWWLKLVVVLFLPFAIVIGTYQLAMQFPGTAKLSAWEWFSSAVFLLNLVPIFLLLWQPNKFLFGRIGGGILLTFLFVYSSFGMHVHATCEYIPPYIGGSSPPNAQVLGAPAQSQAREEGC